MKIQPKGTRKEQIAFNEAKDHYDMGVEDLENRYTDFDLKDELFFSHIDESGWPYSAEVFVPHTFTALFEKMARLNGGKPRGRLIPREGGDVMKARIHNELLNFQWDEVGRISDPMVAKYALMDLNARKYGASFAVAPWRCEYGADGEKRFNGPFFKVLNPRDVIANPAYSTVKNWFQYREYLTMAEMQRVNDSVGKPRYKNIDLLEKQIKERNVAKGDSRETNYTPKYRALQGLSDYLGKDETPEFMVIEVVTEWRDDRVIVFSPKYGIILRDEPNPYTHKQIPITVLKYIPVDDDIYGLSEIEPVEKIQKAMNALTSQYIDAVNMDLYKILKVNPTQVQMHTLEWGPGKKWKMNTPDAVVPLEKSVSTANQFVNVYSVLVSMFKEAMGEASAAYSSLSPFGSEKTATEIQETTTTRSIRDNFNQIFLSEAIKKQMHFWHLMNKQFVFNDPTQETFLLRVVGKEAIADFQELGMDEMVADDSPTELEIQMTNIEEGMPMDIQEVPAYPVNVDGEIKTKFEVDKTGQIGTVYMTPEDMTGNYDFIIDVEPMYQANSIDERRAKMEAVALLKDPVIAQMLAAEGKKAVISELLVDSFDQMGLKGGERYFENLTEQDQALAGGAVQGQGGGSVGGAQAVGGLEGNPGVAGQQGVPFVGQPQGL